MNPITKVDLQILDLIQRYIRCDFLDKVLPAITKLCDHGLVPIIAAVLLLTIPKTRRIGLSMGIAFICGGLIGNLFLKNVVARIRPYDLTDFDVIIERLSDYSFPSGHTLIAFETAVVLLILLKGRARWIAIVTTVLASIIAFSRLYLYVHYPTDILAGIVLGTLFGIIGARLGEHIIDKIKDNSNKAQR